MKFSVEKEIKYIYRQIMKDMAFFGTFGFVIFMAIILLISNQTNFVQRYILGIAIFFVVELVVKMGYKKVRPDFKKNKPISWYDEFEEKHSFPSGHAGKIALFTTMIHLFYGSTNFTVLFGAITILVGVSRMSLQRHYLKDVISGYAVGFLVAIFVFSFF